MTRGSAFYLWIVKAPGVPAVPWAVTDEPAPADVPGLYSVPIGSSGAARFGEMVSHGVAELARLMSRYLTIDKVLPPWRD